MTLRSFFQIFFGAMIAYVIIVISHESGHYTAARFMGYSHARMHSTHTDTGANPVIEEYKTLLARNKWALKTGVAFPEEERLMLLNMRVSRMADTLAAHNYDIGKGSLCIYAGGPLVTLLIGILSLLMLYKQRARSRFAMRLSLLQCTVLLFAALVWVKPIYEIVGALILQLAKGHADILTDEYKISSLLGIYPWSINIVEGCVGVLLLRKTFTFIPPEKKRIVSVAFVFGAIAGYMFMLFVGRIILP